jgi:DNA invertase Pin-like site-specific DNA recombinase
MPRKKLGSKAKPRTVAYLRVSTSDQDTEKNEADILKFSNVRNMGQVQFVTETVSGRKPWRERKIAKVIEDLKEGDRLIVPELSRLGRSTLEVLEMGRLILEKGIKFYSLKENLTLNSDMKSKVFLTIFGLLAELERDFVSERTKEGLRVARAKGKLIGRPRGPGRSKLDPHRPEIEALLRQGSTKAYIAERYGTSPANLIHYLKTRNIKIEPDLSVPIFPQKPKIRKGKRGGE